MAPGPEVAPGPSRRIVVLPMANISPDSRDTYFADGMTEELISTLSRNPEFRVIARTSAMRYRATTKSIAEIGRELNVEAALEGSVRKAERQLRVTVQLIDARTEEPLWSRTYDRELEDVFAIQRDIARTVAKALKVRLPRRADLPLPAPSPKQLDAYTLYLDGRYRWNQRTQGALKEAIGRFEQAVAQDPTYALALTGLADAYAVQALLEFVPPTDAFPKARKAAEAALALDPELAEAHASLGLVHFQYDHDWAGAERELGRSIALNPSNPLAHQYLADYLKAMGRFDEALAQMGRALELDPVSLAINTGLGHVLYLSRQYDAAIAQYRKALDLDPQFVQAHLWFGRPYLEKGMFPEAIAELREAVRLSGGSTISLAVLAHALASAGERAEAERILAGLLDRAKTVYVPSYWIGLIYTGLDDRDEALRWLERAYAERSSWLAWIKVEPRFDRLRSDERFQSLLERMHLGPTRSAGRPAPIETERFRRFLAELEEVKLARFRVVGDYMRFDSEDRHRLKDLCQELARGLGAPPRTESFLLWAPPGSGKTYLAQEAARQVGPAARLFEVNLAELGETQFRSALEEMQSFPGPAVGLIDEVDSQPEAAWPFEVLLPELEPSGRRPRARVIVLAGSTGGSLAEMRRSLESRPKGPDLLSRISAEHQVTLPPLKDEDRVIVAVSTLLRLTRGRKPPVGEIERLALFFLGVDPELASPRRIRDCLRRAVDRLGPAEDRLKFDHLFAPGDARNKEFWVHARSEGPSLLTGYVRIEL